MEDCPNTSLTVGGTNLDVNLNIKRCGMIEKLDTRQDFQHPVRPVTSVGFLIQNLHYPSESGNALTVEPSMIET